MYIAWMCELGHLHPIWVKNKCTMNDCTVALTIKDWLESVWYKVKHI